MIAITNRHVIVLYVALQVSVFALLGCLTHRAHSQQRANLVIPSKCYVGTPKYSKIVCQDDGSGKVAHCLTEFDQKYSCVEVKETK